MHYSRSLFYQFCIHFNKILYALYLNKLSVFFIYWEGLHWTFNFKTLRAWAKYLKSVFLKKIPKSNFSLDKILKQYNFKVIFSSINKLSLSKLKDPTDALNSWGIYSIACQCGLLTQAKLKAVTLLVMFPFNPSTNLIFDIKKPTKQPLLNIVGKMTAFLLPL